MPVKSFRILTIFYALAVLISFIPFCGIRQNYISNVLEFGTILSALLMLLCYRCQNIILPVLVTVFICFFIEGLPDHPNHRYVLFFFTLFLLPTAYKFLINQKKRAIQYFWQATQPKLITACAVIYFFAFLAKLNYSYVDPNQSCATIFMGHVIKLHLDWLPANATIFLNYFSIYSSIICELAIVPLLIFKQTRILAVLLGLVFHFGLALDFVKYFTNFSSVMYILLLASSGPKFLSYLGSNLFLQYHRWFLGLPSIFILTLVLLGRSSLLNQQQLIVNVLMSSFWLIMAAIIIWNYACWLITKKNDSILESQEQYSLTTYSPTFYTAYNYLIITLLLINGLSPYLGLKTRVSINMYSNLWVDNFGSNHFVVRKSPDLLGVLKDYAYISEAPRYAAKNCSEQLLEKHYYPLAELARLTNKCGLSDYTFEYAQQTWQAANPKTIELLKIHTNSIKRTFLAFTPLGEQVTRQCVW